MTSALFRLAFAAALVLVSTGGRTPTVLAIRLPTPRQALAPSSSSQVTQAAFGLGRGDISGAVAPAAIDSMDDLDARVSESIPKERYADVNRTSQFLATGALLIRKIARGTGQPLGGGRFGITGDAGYSTVATTDATTGLACVDGLPLDTYTVTETAAPPGYTIDTTSQRASVVSQGSCSGRIGTAAVLFTNTPLAPMATSTMTSTSTATATATITATASQTATATVTATLTASQTATATPSAPQATGTPVTCLTPTITATPTWTVVAQLTPTATLTAQATAAPTLISTPTTTTTPGLTRTPTVTDTPAVTSTPAATGTPAAMSTPAATTTPQASGGVTSGGATGSTRPAAAATATTPFSSGAPTPTPTPTPTLSATATSAPTAAGPQSPGVVAAQTPGAHNSLQLIVLDVALSRVRARQVAPRPAPAQPPVQLPPLADGAYNWIMQSAFRSTRETQETTGQANPCAQPEISMSSSADPGSALVGESVGFTYTVTNPGTVDLTDLEVASALPSGVDFVSASGGGSVNPDTGYVEWALSEGLPAGTSTQLSISATIADPGEWTNDACSAGLDASGGLAKDCVSTSVIGMVATATPTPTVIATETLGPTQPIATPPTESPAPAQPTATPPAQPQPIATANTAPPTEAPAPAQPIATPPAEPAQPIATPPDEPAQPIATPAGDTPAPAQPIASPPPEPQPAPLPAGAAQPRGP